MLYYKLLRGMVSIKILTNSKEIVEMKNEMIALYRDMNNTISIIIKDSSIENVDNIELSHFTQDNKENLILKLNHTKTYQEILENNEEEMKIFKTLEKMKTINVIVYAKEENIHQIITVQLKNSEK